ncbi:EAL domain-containing protein [Thauera sp. 2A1]|uniref:EAL domain-containing protein n=1 Tax=Thauera sp. 2A1 TaxID=2570191 RepID=UPI001D174361|nr:EAL domain-containing protein [Thauera sp. 2A1]KAI5914416.1 EAL domain-containing protein [Thauera sp. 2A1]
MATGPGSYTRAMRSLSVNLLISLAYALTGAVALQFTVPPGYTAAAFPPAGIALSALLIFGLRSWPAVYLGSLVVQIFASWPMLGEPGWNPLGLLIVPLGASLQAVAGTLLARRLIDLPNALDTPRSVLRFLGVAAPVSSLISPSIAIPALVWAKVIPVSEAAFNWWSWWAGDTLGVLIAAPLMFVLAGKPAAAWRSRRTGVAIPMAIALVLLGLAHRQVMRWEDQRVEVQFARDAEHFAERLNKRLGVQLDVLLSIERLMAVSPDVNRSEFGEFVHPWMQAHPGTQSLNWSPLVRHADRAAFEERMRAEGLDGYTILDRDEKGRTFPAVEHDEYLPNAYVEPFANNRNAVGLNPLSLPVAAQALAKTRETGLPVATSAIRLVQESGSQLGVMIYRAVREAGNGRTLGVISAALRMDDLLASAADEGAATGIELCLTDLSAASESARLSGAPDCQSAAWIDRQVSHRTRIAFAGREWELRSRATAAYLDTLRGWAAWSTIAAGLLATGMLGALLLITTGSRRRITGLVEQRTAELEATSARLNEKQEALADAQRIARMGSWETVPGSKVLHASTMLHQLLGCDQQKLKSVDDLIAAVSPDSRKSLRKAFESLAETPGRMALDCRIGTSSPRILQFRIESEWRDGRLIRLRGTAQDVTGAREAQAQIQYLAHYDTLTGLPNRSAWQERARAALVAAQRHGDALAVLFLDLDNFKTVNDSLGHPAGDRLLAAVARRLSGCIRGEDLLARLGGDEFVALLPRLTHSEDAAVVASKMIDVLSHPVHIDDHDLHLSVSIGIALFPEDGTEADTLLKHADTAMYSAKEGGRNNYKFFVPEMNARATERLRLENDLRRALERNELVLHYQPQIETATGAPYGCEALVRWIQPERGLIPPDQFIPLAESTGLIVPLGEWVLRQACLQQVAWQRAGLPRLLVAVNISALQFHKPDFVDRVSSVLAETGADPACIELEITESALMQPGDDLSARLLKLVDLGLTLALDDFGTGYSSLAYLKRLPIGRLKIDRSFVDDLPGNAEDAAVASAALSLARDLGMEVVAEGVEDHAQRTYLTERGCHAMQGYLFSRPLPADMFEKWMANFVSAAHPAASPAADIRARLHEANAA